MKITNEMRMANIWMKRFYESKRTIELLRDDIERLSEQMDGLKAQVLTGMPHGSGNDDRKERIIDQLNEDIEKYYNEIESQKETQNRIRTAIMSIPDFDIRNSLYYYYIFGYTYDKVGEKTHFSGRQAFNHVMKGLQMIYDAGYCPEI